MYRLRETHPRPNPRPSPSARARCSPSRRRGSVRSRWCRPLDARSTRCAQFRTSARESLEANLRLNFISMKSSLIIGTLIALSTAAMYYVGSRHVLEGTLTARRAHLDLRAAADALPAAGSAHASRVGARGRGRGRAALLRGARPARTTCPTRPARRRSPSAAARSSYEDVSFGYTTRPRRSCSGVNLRIEPGQTVAFVGGTGAGKSHAA